MFDKICIKNKESDSYKLDVGFVIDTMLFYGKVVLLIHKEELIILLKFLGEDLLRELIKRGRLELRFRDNIIGSMIFPNGRYNIDTFSSPDVTIDSILYQSHREIINNSSKNQKFASEFSGIIEPYSYPAFVRESIISDFSNEHLLKRALPVYINSIVPEFILPEKIEIEIIKEAGFGPYDAYSLKSNIDVDELNRVHKESRPEIDYDIDYSGFLLSVGESKGDIHIASELEKLGIVEVRTTIAGHTQRGGEPTPYDRILSTRLGAKGAELIISKNYGNLVVFKDNEISYIPLSETAGKLKVIDDNSPIIKECENLGISFCD